MQITEEKVFVALEAESQAVDYVFKDGNAVLFPSDWCNSHIVSPFFRT